MSQREEPLAGAGRGRWVWRVGDTPVPRGPRLRTFCDAYGLQDRGQLLDVLRIHLHMLDSSFARNSIPFLDDSRAEWEDHLM